MAAASTLSGATNNWLRTQLSSDSVNVESLRIPHSALRIRQARFYHSSRIVTCTWRGRKPKPPKEFCSVTIPSVPGVFSP